MARKFKVGDKVKIVKDVVVGDNNTEHCLKLGRVGKMIRVSHVGGDYPYGVQLRNRYGICWFNVRELELIERKGNK